MESIIYKYLGLTYYVDLKTNKVFEEGDQVYCTDLVEEVYLYFGINGDEAEDYIESWILSKEPDFDMEKYWKDVRTWWGNGDPMLPIAERVAAQMVAQDLVAVQPMEAPQGLLFYIDNSGTTQSQHYVISGTTRPNAHGRVYDREIFEREYLNMHPSRFGEIDHPDDSGRLHAELSNYAWRGAGIDLSARTIDAWTPIISGITMI